MFEFRIDVVLIATVTMMMYSLPLAVVKYWENLTFSVVFGNKHNAHCRLLKPICLKMEITKPVYYFWDKIESNSGTLLPVHIKNTLS